MSTKETVPHQHPSVNGFTGQAILGPEGRHWHNTAAGPSSLDIPLRGGGHTHASAGKWLGSFHEGDQGEFEAQRQSFLRDLESSDHG